MGDPRTEALQLHGIGQIHLALRQEDQAQSYFAEAERIFDAIGMQEAAANSSRAGADAAARRSLRSAVAAYNELISDGRTWEAIEALDRWAALGHGPTPSQQSMLLGLYGFAEFVAGRLERAAERFGEALKLDRDLRNDAMAANHLGNVGDLYRRLGDGQHAELAYRTALQLADVPEGLRAKLADGLQLAQELGADTPSGGLDPEIARDVGLELANRNLDGVVDVNVTFDDGHTITGRVVSVALGPKLPEITLELPGGLPLELALGAHHIDLAAYLSRARAGGKAPSPVRHALAPSAHHGSHRSRRRESRDRARRLEPAVSSPVRRAWPSSHLGRRAPDCDESTPSADSAASAAPRSPRSSSLASSPKRSGTCSPAASPSLRQAPVFVWR
jgi:hypothetical protein